MSNRFKAGTSIDEQTSFNVNQTHPLIPNSQNYTYYQKHVSILCFQKVVKAQ